MNKRILGGIMAAGLAFSAFSASAAQLNVTADALQVGETDLTCDENGVEVTVLFEDNEPQHRRSNGVIVSGIDEDCAGENLLVWAVGTGDNGIGVVHTVLPESLSGDHTETLRDWSRVPAAVAGDLPGTILPEHIDSLAVQING